MFLLWYWMLPNRGGCTSLSIFCLFVALLSSTWWIPVLGCFVSTPSTSQAQAQHNLGSLKRMKKDIYVWVRRFYFSEYDRNTLYDLVQWHTESRVSYRAFFIASHSSECWCCSIVTPVWMQSMIFFLSTQFIYDEVWVMTVQAITPVLTQTHLQHSVFMFMKHNVTIAWIIIYLPSPLTSVVAVPFANWIDVVAVLLFISWSMTFWCVRPALQVAGVWPHSSVTSVSWSLAEEIQGKMETGDKDIL